jgi:hypothetical protein
METDGVITERPNLQGNRKNSPRYPDFEFNAGYPDKNLLYFGLVGFGERMRLIAPAMSGRLVGSPGLDPAKPNYFS